MNSRSKYAYWTGHNYACRSCDITLDALDAAERCREGLATMLRRMSRYLSVGTETAAQTRKLVEAADALLKKYNLQGSPLSEKTDAATD